LERGDKMKNEKRTETENKPPSVIEELTVNETGTEKIKGGVPGAMYPGYDWSKQIKI
jgi:hypothetical protein